MAAAKMFDVSYDESAVLELRSGFPGKWWSGIEPGIIKLLDIEVGGGGRCLYSD